MAGGAESAVDEGAEAAASEDVEDLAEHDGHVIAGGVGVAAVEVGVELGQGAGPLL